MLSWLNPTARALPVYASQRRSPSDHATLGSGWLPALTGQDWLPAGFQRKGSALRRRIPLSQALPVASRAHNQHAAECAFGADFMEGKRAAARRDRADDRGCDHRDVAAQRAGAAEAGRRAQAAADGARRRAEARERTADVIAAMRSLGCRMDEARRAAELSESIPDASLED